MPLIGLKDDARLHERLLTSGGMRLLTVLVTILAILVTTLTATPALADRSGTLRWGDCPDVGAPIADVRCATLEVPVDYRNPYGPTLSLTISKVTSTNPAKRRGVLLMNPGGPGGSGLFMP